MELFSEGVEGFWARSMAGSCLMQLAERKGGGQNG
jgi:hypothetical protein